MVEHSSSDGDWENFQQKLLNAKASHKGKECKGPRYAVYDFQYELEGGEGTRYVMRSCIHGIPEDVANKIAGTKSSSSRGLQMKAHLSL